MLINLIQFQSLRTSRPFITLFCVSVLDCLTYIIKLCEVMPVTIGVKTELSSILGVALNDPHESIT